MQNVNPYSLEKRTSTNKSAPLAVDLFSGAGGLTLGLQSAGIRVVLSSDIDAGCAATHRKNLPNIPFICGDIRDSAVLSGSAIRASAGLGTRDLDILAGGPPCQGFSIIGPRMEDDPRNALFRQFMRIAEELRPRVILMENVPGMATLGRGAIFREVAKAFDKAGYVVDCAELLAAQYGVPQMRWRMVFVGWRKDIGQRGGFPMPTHGKLGIGDLVPNRTVTEAQQEGFLRTLDAIGDLPPVGAGETVSQYLKPPSGAYQEAMRQGATRTLSNHYAPKLAEQNLARITMLKPGQDWRALPFEMLPASMQRALRKDHTRRFRRMTWDGVPRSIITRFRDPKSGEYIHPSQTRTITIREAARIQSFPDWFEFVGSNTDVYTQVGNAVPPLLGKAVGAALIRALSGEPERFLPIKSRYSFSFSEQDLALA